MVPLRRIRHFLSSLGTAPSPLPADAVLELGAIRSFLDRWQQHPDFQTFRLGLYAEYLHTVLSVALASFLEDVGNGVNLVRASSARAPDLQMVVGARARAACEIKAPRALYRPSDPIAADCALRVIEKAVKSAGTGSRGQLASNGSSLLAIGGFGLSPADMDSLEAAAGGFLAKETRKGKKKLMLGIALLSIGVHIETSNTDTTLSLGLQVRTAPNHGYQGSLKLDWNSRSVRPLIDRHRIQL